MFQLPINPRAPVARLNNTEARQIIERYNPPAETGSMSGISRMLWRRRRARRYG